MNTYRQGDAFDPEGYDLIASINSGAGVGNPHMLSADVFCNNSSHFLVAKCYENYPESDNYFIFDSAFDYSRESEDEGTDGIYHMALKRAIAVALGLAIGRICSRCNGHYPSDQSCPCFDNGSE